MQKQLEIKEGPSGYNGVTEERAPKCKYRFSSNPMSSTVYYAQMGKNPKVQGN